MNRQVEKFIGALARQGIAVDVAAIDPHQAGRLSTVRLRFDREALRFIDDVQTALGGSVPAGKTLMFAITAPLRLASKTAASLVEKVHKDLARRSARIDLDATINGNGIRVRLVKGVSRGAIVFVHNPDSDPTILFDATQALLRRLSTDARARKRSARAGRSAGSSSMSSGRKRATSTG